MTATPACGIYARGITYSDEFFLVQPDPLLDASLRRWSATGDGTEVLSLLAH
jgi:hypothetical protein